MVLTTSKMKVSLLCLLVLSGFTIGSALAQGTVGLNGDTFVSDTAKIQFNQTPLHGQIDGIDFKPLVAEIIFMRSGGKPGGVYKISFKDGGGRQIDLTVYNALKFEDVNYVQTPLSPVTGAAKVGAVVDLRNLSPNDFGIRMSLGKFSGTKTQPVYVVFRLDRNNWLEGYIYAQVHERLVY